VCTPAPQKHSKLIDEVLLLSPLGQVIARILRDHEGGRLTTSEQQEFYASDVESLTEDILGWRIPLAGLKYWALGTHSPLTIAMKDLDENGRVVAIRQDGWIISYLSYTAMQSAQKQRPRVLTLNHETLKIRLVVNNLETK
jgi:outer membrane lipoprotein LolB